MMTRVVKTKSLLGGVHGVRRDSLNHYAPPALLPEGFSLALRGTVANPGVDPGTRRDGESQNTSSQPEDHDTKTKTLNFDR